DPNLLAIPEMRAWLLRANLTPQRLSSLSFIHIAGTKGKGSVTALTTSALLHHSSSTSSSSSPSAQIGPIGTYTSPHLLSPRERIAISGHPISQSLFATSFFELWDTLSACTTSSPGGAASTTGPDLGLQPGAKPFYFRFLTLLALHVFLKHSVRAVVLECGIGGEYDATNAIPGDAVTTSVITQLGIDHVAMLGSTASQIAWHKAGVMKPGTATFTRKLSEEGHPGVMATLRSRAREIGAELIEVDDEDVERWTGVPGAKLPGGDFQKRNQALAALAARRHIQVLQVREAGSKTVEVNASLADVPEVIIAGLREATLRGRHEVLRQGKVSWYLDGAHNADSLAEVARWISPILTSTDPSSPSDTTRNDKESFVLVFNQQERDASSLLKDMLRQMSALGVDLERRLSAAIVTRNDKTNIAGEGGDVDLTVQQTCAAAFREMYPATKVVLCRDLTEMKSTVDGVAEQSSGTKVLVTGSMYLVGNVIGLLEPEGLL
ncbi:Mur ligase, partial [Colletotrichum phormii]